MLWVRSSVPKRAVDGIDRPGVNTTVEDLIFHNLGKLLFIDPN
jgi:hypothetical protein